ncbi:MAG TPA: hypothetical protein H9691_08720 [Firmicutes bacterium]|nr:hypothetical protein [Bacillota bacterium]
MFRDYQESIAEDSLAKLKEGVLEFVGKTHFQRYLMIVKFTFYTVSGNCIQKENGNHIPLSPLPARFSRAGIFLFVPGRGRRGFR